VALTVTAAQARERLVNQLHPAIREFVHAADEVRAAFEARDMRRLGAAIQTMAARQDEYLEVAEQ